MPDDRPKFFDSALFAPAMKALTRGHVALFRAMGGRLGSRFRFGSAFPSGVPVCLLTTRGRKSGRLRTMALLYLPDGDRVVLVASRGGTGKHPQWYLNVAANPKVAVQTGRRLVAFYPEYAAYQRWTARTIPVVICDPT